MTDIEAEEEVQYLKSLGATDETLLNMALDGNHANFVVCPLPFNSLDESDAISVPIEFGGNLVTLTLRKSLSDKSWWLSEEGSVNNTEVDAVQRFMLDTYKHLHANWMYIIVSPYAYKEDMSEQLKRQCLMNCSLLIKY